MWLHFDAPEEIHRLKMFSGIFFIILLEIWLKFERKKSQIHLHEIIFIKTNFCRSGW